MFSFPFRALTTLRAWWSFVILLALRFSVPYHITPNEQPSPLRKSKPSLPRELEWPVQVNLRERRFSLKQDPENRLCKAQTCLGVPFKSVALKIAERSNSELLDFLGSLIRVSIRLGVLIWLHNLILLHNQNVTLLRSCGYIWRGLEDFLAFTQCPWRDMGALVKGGESLLGERISPAYQLSGWASPGVGRSRRHWRTSQRTTLSLQYLMYVASDVLKWLGLDLPLLLKAGALEGYMINKLIFFQKKLSNWEYLSSRKGLFSTISISCQFSKHILIYCMKVLC